MKLSRTANEIPSHPIHRVIRGKFIMLSCGHTPRFRNDWRNQSQERRSLTNPIFPFLMDPYFSRIQIALSGRAVYCTFGGNDIHDAWVRSYFCLDPLRAASEIRTSNKMTDYLPRCPILSKAGPGTLHLQEMWALSSHTGI